MKHYPNLQVTISICMLALYVAACGGNPKPVNPPSTAQPPTNPPPTVIPRPTTILPTSIPTRVPVAAPTGRGYHAMTYDSESRRVILYGGSTGNPLVQGNISFETWSFDPLTHAWKLMSPAVKPGGGTPVEMTYDSQADRSILIVGADPATPNFFDFQELQTWAYDFNTDVWTRLANAPLGGNLGPRIVYDSESDKVILFGGATLLGDFKLFNETWVYDYKADTWTQMKPPTSPMAMNYHAMAYDPKADKVLLWGGDDSSMDNTSVMKKTFMWTYDYNENTWNELSMENKPASSYYNTIVYDDKKDLFVIFGGLDSGNDETWTFDLNSNTWQQMNPSKNPGKLSRYGMVYSPDVDKVILFGGQIAGAQFSYSAITWFYDLSTNTWTE